MTILIRGGGGGVPSRPIGANLPRWGRRPRDGAQAEGDMVTSGGMRRASRGSIVRVRLPRRGSARAP